MLSAAILAMFLSSKPAIAGTLFGSEPEASHTLLFELIAFIAVCTVITIAVILLWNAALRRRVAKATEHMEEANRRLLQSRAIAKDNEEYYTRMAENIPGIVYQIGRRKDGTYFIPYASPAIKDLFGISPESLRRNATPLIEMIPKEDFSRIESRLMSSVREEMIWKDEIRIVTGEKVRWFQGVARPEKQPDGSLVWDGILLEITERIKADAERNQLRRLLKNVVDAMPAMLIAIDSHKRVTLMNEAAADAAVDLPQPLSDDIHPFLDELFPFLTCEIPDLLTGNRTGDDTPEKRVCLTQPDGSNRWLDVVVYSLKERDLEGAVIRIDDVTERVRIEEMMIQSEKMISLGSMAAGMAHEINNPLAGVLQNAQVLRSRLSEDLPKNQKSAENAGITLQGLKAYAKDRNLYDILDEIMDTGGRASKIVRNMLSFSRKPGYGEQVTRDIIELIEGALELAAHDYDLKKHHDFRQIQIVRHYETPLPELICEGEKLQQVFLNLFINAAHAMQDIGKTPRIDIRVEALQEKMIITISDNGPGIPEAVRKHIFEPFFTTKPPGMGTGLGLAVSYYIISDHQGRLEVDSDPESGTTFRIILPADPSADRP